MVHDAFEARVDVDGVELLHRPTSGDAELIVGLEDGYVGPRWSVGCVMFVERRIGIESLIEPPVGCAYPSSRDTGSTELMCTACDNAVDVSRRVLLETSEDWVDNEAVSLEYGA